MPEEPFSIERPPSHRCNAPLLCAPQGRWTVPSVTCYRKTVSSLRVPVRGIRAGRIELEPETARYVSRVHRLRQGAPLLLFDPEQRLEADAVLILADRRSVVCEADSPRPASRVASHPLWLLQGISKGDRFDLAVRDASALGVTDIVPVAFARCDGKLAEASEARRHRWERIAVEASRQSGRGDVAHILAARTPAAAFASVPEGSRICLWELSERPLASLREQLMGSTAISLIVGPEGGLEPDEVDLARSHGFVDVSLGPFVLRTETATTAALGAMRVLCG